MTQQRRKTPRVAAQGPCAIRDPDGTEHAFELGVPDNGKY